MKKILYKSIFVIAALLTAATTVSAETYMHEDSITRNRQDYAYLTAYTEANYAAFPAIMKAGYEADYLAQKDSVGAKISSGEWGIRQAACEYVYWFNAHFDAHFYVDQYLFWQVYKRRDTPDYKHLMNYAPQAVSQRVNRKTWLLRVPSCAGQNPTNEWVAQAVETFLQSGCRHLIIDLRGNSGGSDMIWIPLLPLLIDHQANMPETYWFRNTYANRYSPAMQDWLLAQIANNEDPAPMFLQVGAEDDEEDEAIPAHDARIHISFIIDRKTASSAETILRVARNYTDRDRYTIYGKENSAGAAETGNLFPFHLPNSRIRVFYPTTVSSGFLRDGQQNGAAGIAPDVRIELPYPDTLTDNVDSWVLDIAKRPASPNHLKEGAQQSGQK